MSLLAPGGTLMPGSPRPSHHPFANLFPMLAEDRRSSFKQSLQTLGQTKRIVLMRGMILDGRNRERELTELGKPVAYDIFTGTNRQALDYVIAENLERRDLTDKQRAMIAAKIATYRLGDNQHTRQDPAAQPLPLAAPEPAQEIEAPPIGGGAASDLSHAEAAKVMHVSTRSVERAAVIERSGVPELKQVVESDAASLATAEALAQRPPEEQRALLESLPRDDAGKLTPEAKKQIRQAAKEVRAEDQADKKKKRAERERELGQKILAMPGIKAGLILSDFEWDFKVRSRETGMDRHASNHYVTAADCDTAEDIAERQRERMSVAADDCIHLMWTTSAFLSVALKVMELQGFTYVSHFVWIKPGMGTGFWVRECHELLLIGVKGKIPCPAMGDQFRSAIEAPRGEHSEKPDFQYEIAERYFETLPKVELNARRARKGWIGWGNEAPEAPAQAAMELEAAE